MRRLILILTLCVPAWAGYINGLGGSTLTCLDVDGDGYGVGASCTGPDADDFDATVHTAAQGITKYGSLTKFIAHLGYTTKKFWCMSPSGSDGNGASNADAAKACTTPFLHFTAIQSTLAPGDVVLMRSNWNDAFGSVSGSSGLPIVYLAYPGEMPVFNNPAAANAGGHLAPWNTVDGAILTVQADIKCSTTPMSGSSTCHDILVRHVEGRGSIGAGGLGPISGFNNLQNWTNEYDVLHDNTSQHGIYMGSDDLASSNVTFRKSIAYNNQRNGFTFNGRCTNCVFDQLISYNNGIAGLTLEMGVSNSFIRSNLVFSNAAGQITLFNYDGDSCSTAPYICPFDQTGNLFENNTIYHTGNDQPDGAGTGSGCPAGIQACGGDAFRIANLRTDQVGNLGGNTFRNNVLVNYGFNNTYPPVSYLDGTNTCGSTCQAWFSSSTWTDLVAMQADGNNGTAIFRLGDQASKYTCAQAASHTTLSGCQNADPKFVAASITYWNSVGSFDFRLQASSPALHSGTPTGQPNYDTVGRAYTTTTPSMGSRERNSFTQGWNTLPGLTVSIVPANGASGSLDNNGNPYAYQYYAPAGITVPWAGAFYVANPTNPRLCPWGGGHDDYGGNEIYCLNFNLATPTMTRVNNPTQISVWDYTHGPHGLPDIAPNTRCQWSTCQAPAPAHSGNLLSYSPDLNKSFAFEVGGYGIAGDPSEPIYNTWVLDWSTSPPTWSSGNPVSCPGGCVTTVGQPVDPVVSFIGAPVAYGVQVWDSNRKLNWVNPGNGYWATWDPATKVYILRTTGAGTIIPAYQYTALFDAKRNLIWAIGGGQIQVVDTSVGGSAGLTTLTSSVNANCATLMNSIAPGLGYDSLTDVIYGWPTNGGGTIYRMDLSNYPILSCTTLAAGSGPGPSGTTLGTYGRMTYSDALDAIVLVPGFNENAFIYSLPAADSGTNGVSGGPPVVSMTGPANGTTVGGTITVSATATDSLGVSSVQFTLDGSNLGGIVTTSPFAVPWDTTKSANGSHTLSAVATDAAGNSATAAAITVTVNTSISGPPVVSMTGPANGTTVSGTITVSATATDSLGVSSVQFILDGSGLGSIVTISPFAVPWDTTKSANGAHTLSAVAIDAAGNSTTAGAITVTANNSTSGGLGGGGGLNGLGGSTYTCLDVDGDGYGVGATCTGPDADDFDPTVQTAAQGIAKYGTLTKFIAHLGYTTTKFWCMSPSGNDGTAASNADAATACTRPFAHFLAIQGSISPGDVILMRANWNDAAGSVPGTAGNPIVYLAYPGEMPVLNNPAAANAGFHLNNYNTVDGAILTVQADVKCSTTQMTSPSTCTGILVRHVEGRGSIGAGGLGPISGFNDLHDWINEYDVLHDNTSQHGIYMGSDDLASTNVVYRKSIAYNNNRNGFTFNGRCTNCVFEQLISYNNGIAGLTLEMGVSNSFIRSNLIFSNAGGQVVVFNYDGDSCSTAPYICPFDQTGNLFENNTIYHTGNDFPDGPGTGSGCPTGIQACGGDAIRIANLRGDLAGSLGNNTFRNNILVNYGFANTYPPVAYLDGTNTCGSTCQAWFSSSTWTDLIAMQADGNNGTAVFRLGDQASRYTCPQAASHTTLSGCQNADPKFVAASINYWNSVGSFDFRLQASSPALHAGSSVSAPSYDLVGTPYGNPPSIGAREISTAAYPTSCDLNGDGSVNVLDVQSAVNQALGITACTTGDLMRTGQCNVIDVQRVVAAATGGACVLGN